MWLTAHTEIAAVAHADTAQETFLCHVFRDLIAACILRPANEEMPEIADCATGA